MGSSQEKKKKVDYYKVLGVPRGAGNDQVGAKNSPTSFRSMGIEARACTAADHALDGYISAALSDLHCQGQSAIIFPLSLSLPASLSLSSCSMKSQVSNPRHSLLPFVCIRSRAHTGASPCSATPTRRKETQRYVQILEHFSAPIVARIGCPSLPSAEHTEAQQTSLSRNRGPDTEHFSWI